MPAVAAQLNFYEVNANGYWVANAVDAQVNNSGDVSCSLAFHFNRPAIAYRVYDGFPAQPDVLRYAHRGGSLAFSVTQVGPARGSGSSLAFAPNGHPSIAFYKANPGGTGYLQAGSNLSVWTGSTVDPKGSGVNISLAFTQPVTRPLPTRSCTTGTLGSSNTPCSTARIGPSKRWPRATTSPSLGFDSSGPRSSFMGGYFSDPQPPAVMCARRGPSAWQISKVVDWADSPSLAFTPAGDPAIAYVDLATTPPSNMPSTETAPGRIIWSTSRSSSKLPPKAGTTGIIPRWLSIQSRESRRSPISSTTPPVSNMRSGGSSRAAASATSSPTSSRRWRAWSPGGRGRGPPRPRRTGTLPPCSVGGWRRWATDAVRSSLWVISGRSRRKKSCPCQD